MTYPRRCPLCEADYRGPGGGRVPTGVVSDLRHATLSVVPGGTPSPWRPSVPGRLLTLHCLACRGEYIWDYFAAPRAQPARPVVETRAVAPRDRAKGQRAMAAASALAETRGGQRAAARDAGVSPTRVAYAAVVLEHAPELAAPVLAGALSLDEAYGEARARKRVAPSAVTSGRHGAGGTAMADQRGAEPEVGARVRMKGTGRTGTIQEVLEARGRKLYCVVYEPRAREAIAPPPGETVGESTVYTTADTFDVLP